jgi:Ni/Co efflux regulator RcnB
MNRILSPFLMLASLLAAGGAIAQDYQRGRAADRGEARISGQRHDGGRASTRNDNGAHWNNQRENHWERDTRRTREDNSRFHVQEPDKHYRGNDRRGNDHDRWQVSRGLPHSDPRYRDQSSHRDNRYRDHRNDYRNDHRSDWRDPKWRSSWHHGWSGSRYRAPIRYYYPPGYSRYSWRVGYTLPAAFLLNSWYVDYRPYGLSAPPYGCRWVRVDGDLLLIELASGYIVDALYDFYY